MIRIPIKGNREKTQSKPRRVHLKIADLIPGICVAEKIPQLVEEIPIIFFSRFFCSTLGRGVDSWISSPVFRETVKDQF